MPELPEVETVVRGLRPQLVGRSLHYVPARSLMIATRDVKRFRTGLAGNVVHRLDRFGKWILLRMAGGQTLVFHLGMTGVLTVEAATAALAKHTHFRAFIDEGNRELRFVDPRRFGEIWLATNDEIEHRLGPDQLGPDALTIKRLEFTARLRSSARAIKAVLLDQRVISGVGNIYADESLFAAGIHPARKSRSLLEPEIERLWKSLRGVLTRAIRNRGTSIRDYRGADGRQGGHQRHLKIYQRAGESCLNCGSQIELSRTILSGRATCWCPVCQPLTRLLADPGRMDEHVVSNR